MSWIKHGSNLPNCKFEWLKNVDKFVVNSVRQNSLIGYIVEVDLEYSDELHYLHNGLSLAPETLGFPYDTLSKFFLKKC